MNLEETELKIGDTKLRGVWIAIVLSLGTTIGGGVWTASSLYSRLEAVEDYQIPDIAPIEERLAVIDEKFTVIGDRLDAIKIPDVEPLKEQISLVEQELEANDVSQLQGKLATLGTNLETIMEQQNRLLTLKEEITELNSSVENMRVTVQKAEIVAEQIGDFESTIKRLQTEINELWEGMDYLANPLN